ncbi:cell wall hydrolase [Leptolyngbya sp. 'hensonii']|uniref:hormogonium tapered terminus morphoprotein TftA n=1 Tax=Leptolyngbya sp. 'hensonii' TaxID=1922337 RepID=UPI0009500D78|nr:N-acetylmuramoyl-L-alanine amidase [Leptolyngbya sp. 'hensonii']OLP16031.1 cell wall hydrolase [Leptolyngbya sp. 'hensonii']
MGRIFISAGHGGLTRGVQDPGAMVAETTEAREMILTRDLIVTELRLRNLDVLAVPDDLNLTQTIDWINVRATREDVALEIHADAFSNPTVRGASVFYIANNDDRKAHGDLLLLALLRRVPQLLSRGARPDTATGVGRLAFCRQIAAPSLLLEIGFLTNPDDRFIIQTRRRDIALGIADGLSSWSRAISGGSLPPSPPTSGTGPSEIVITVNGQFHDEKGILLNGNPYVPVDLIDSLGIEIPRTGQVRLVNYRSIVYIKAIELRDLNLSVTWDNNNRTVSLRSILKIYPAMLDQIMGRGQTSEVQLMMFLKTNHESSLAQFPDIAKLYREEAGMEGVNYDIAFCQMCVETTFLRFGGDVKPSQNNFASLGSIEGEPTGATFASTRLGVRAHIQHLKAYATKEPLVQELVDPRFRFITRGIAPQLEQLGGRWSADMEYGSRILALVRRLYESSGLL